MQLNRQGLSQRARFAQPQLAMSGRLPLHVRVKAAPGTASFNTTASGNGAANGHGVAVASPQPVTVNFPPQVPGFLAPPANYAALAQAGAAKTQMSVGKLLVSGFLAGCFIGYGGFLTFSVQGGLPGLAAMGLPGLLKLIGGLIFPVGLMLVIASGAELYTGNTAVVTMAVHEKKASMGGLLHNWVWSYIGNFIGSLAMVAAVFGTGMLTGNPLPVAAAEMKCGLPWANAFLRAVLCNWLVCMAVWNASAATSLPGKIMGLWPPIATFVAIGLEHSVANMFFIPLGICLGAKVTFTEFLVNNLIPVTLGNTFAGVMFVATLLGICHGGLGKKPSPPSPAASNN